MKNYLGYKKVGWAAKEMLYITKAEKEFGFKVKTSFEKVFIRTMEWYRNYGV